MNDVLKAVQSLVEKLRQQEQAANLSTHTPEPSTIPEKESDEVIKSSVEDLVPIPSESEDTSDNDSECDLPFCDDYFPLDILGEDIESKDSYVSNLDEQALLVTHLFELNEDECFDPGGDEIEACLTSDSIPPRIDGADFDPEGDIFLLEKLLNDDISFSLHPKELHFEEGDIIYLESLFIKDTIPNLLPEVFLDYDPKSLHNEPNIDDLKIKENVRITFEDRHYLSLTFIIKIFLPFLTYLVNSLPLLSFGSEDIILTPASPLIVSIP
ncbi:hypothetical protein Tco_0927415 [Tanacetum coccineum]